MTFLLAVNLFAVADGNDDIETGRDTAVPRP